MVAGYAGVSVGAVALTAHDPSSSTFCQVISGSAIAHDFTPPTLGTCSTLELAGVFDSTQCASDFCEEGVHGLALFLGGFLGTSTACVLSCAALARISLSLSLSLCVCVCVQCSAV
eukprot:COSAG05_NODE_274_length_12437_cov_130.209353_7_plen_116_part_00